MRARKSQRDSMDLEKDVLSISQWVPDSLNGVQ